MIPLFLFLMLMAEAPAKPTPVITPEHKIAWLKHSKRSAELQRALAESQDAEMVDGKAMEQDCGPNYEPRLDASGEPMCAPKK